MEIAGLNALQVGLLLTLVIGVNELLVRLRAKDYWTAVTIGCAAVLGGLLGLYWHLDFVVGVAAGFSAAGTLKGLSMLRGGSTASPSEDTFVAK